MKNIVTALLLLSRLSLSAQLSVISNNKPLSFLNPALQNYSMEKGVVSASVIASPFVQEQPELNYLALAEFKVNDDFRVGIHGSKAANRLNSNTTFKAYGSYRLELEKENYLIFGVDVGGYNDIFKPNEFNKVLAPNKFEYDDTTTSGLDLGFGVAYNYSGFTFGIGFSKLNSPPIVPFPDAIWELTADSSSFQLKDTTIKNPDEGATFGLQSNVNVMYEWDANDKVTILHSLQFGNIDLAGVDFIGFQNIATINKRHSLGLGGYYNGEIGFIASAGFGFTESLKLELSSFFAESFNYDVAQSEYISEGYKPALELNLRIQF